jgi:hypothetical protein
MKIQLEPIDLLGQLVMRFRSTRDEEQRKLIAEEYRSLCERHAPFAEYPAFEDMLPDEYMPNFDQYMEKEFVMEYEV